jgi:hypothetical protein
LKLKPEFESFLQWRAKLVAIAPALLTNGKIPNGKSVLARALDAENTDTAEVVD